ncbi:complement component C1q receptor-like [Pristis pectinata]|uniref:complement component C1q receptor-like n=1 Tax=Pristis pectinata TaxID=685728 RepID=UPI00223E3E1D|nr:complement component C1q receptor-like [Pristis pectinata]
MLLLVVQSLLSAVTARLSLPSDTVCVSNACYTAHLDRKPFHQALERCKANGGNLATAKDTGEALLIHKLLSGFPAGQRPKSKFWLGLQLPPRHCYQQHKPLRGFGWTSGGEETTYSNWAREPQSTCTAHRCVHIVSNTRSSSSPDGGNYKWHDGVCSHAADGYLCKFSFKGMCTQIVLSGPGSVTYTTPFDAESSSLDLVPFGSFAVVSCAGGSPAAGYVLCMERVPGRYGWSADGPFCAPPSGCDLDNGGCAQLCVSAGGGGGGGYRCQCNAGYQLGADQRSCELRDHCQDHPCEYRCVSNSLGFECLCPVGYQPAENGSKCEDADECAQRPCAQVCINTPGSFRCDCTQGYALIDSQCRDLDECTGHPCDQSCHNTDGSYMCLCRAGYRLQGTGHSCVDIDECTTRPCQGTCSNTEGSFQCSCSQGYALGEDGVSCIPMRVTTSLTSTVQRWDTTAGVWGLTTPGALVDHATDSGTPSASSGDPTGMGVAAESTAADWTAVPSPTAAKASEEHGSANLSWVLMGALGSVAALLLVLCVVGFILCLRNRSPKKSSNAGDYYSWVQAAGQSPFRASYVKCNRSSDNYMEIEASQTEV